LVAGTVNVPASSDRRLTLRRGRSCRAVANVRRPGPDAVARRERSECSQPAWAGCSASAPSLGPVLRTVQAMPVAWLAHLWSG